MDVRYLPVEEVGGDYCQVHLPDEGSCYITMCDVTGHGIAPGLLATRVSSEVRYNILCQREPREIVRLLNKFIYDLMSEHRIDMRTAAYTHALNRIGSAIEALGTQQYFSEQLESVDSST